MAKGRALFTVLIMGVAVALDAQATAVLDQANAKVVQGHGQNTRSQQKINQLDDASRAAYDEFRALERQSDLVEAYNDQLQKLVDAQQQEITDLDSQIQSLDQTEQAVLPMLARMVDMLARFVDADSPFLSQERADRIERLEALLARADVSLAEKYRQILEAYLIEVDYGRTMEAYVGELALDGQSSRQVNFLRVGRTALYYQTLDGRESGLWQPSTANWQPLAQAQLPELDKAIRIAWQQAVPVLLEMPLPKPELN